MPTRARFASILDLSSEKCVEEPVAIVVINIDFYLKILAWQTGEALWHEGAREVSDWCHLIHRLEPQTPLLSD